MNFLVGVSLTIPLAIFTIVLWLLKERLPKEMTIALIGIMLFGDGLLAGGWYFGLGEEVTNMEQFRLGCGFAFCVTSFGRAIYFMLKGYLDFE